MPIRTRNLSARYAATAASTAAFVDANAAMTPSPVWLNKKTVVRLDRGAQHLVMRLKGRPQRIRVCLPPTGRPLKYR